MCEFGGNSQRLCSNNTCEICFNKSIASNPKSKFWSKKNIKNPREVFKKTDKKYLFDCNICKHEFSISMDNITLKDQWCGYCASQKLCDNLDCESCFDKSFESHPKSKYWSKKNNKSPGDIFKNCHDKYLFECDKCNHTFEKSPNKIISQNTWCQYCAHQLLCNNQDCKMCFNNSFASNPKSEFWSKNNIKTPREVFIKSGNKYKFDCNKCYHEYEKVLCDMDRYGCPYCVSTTLCDKEDCKTCFDRSFASSDKVKYFLDENPLKPRQIFKSAEMKYKFKCENDHTFEMSPHKVTSGNNWCGFCINKTEGKLFNWLEKKYPNIEKQKRFDWCKSKKPLPFDFCIEDLKLLIELDGIQHFEQTSNWLSPEKTQETDKYKTDKALENNYSIIRIFQEDVWNDNDDWETRLDQVIKKYDIPIEIKLGKKYTII
jgi:very-short-patch-repair endonuclease